VAAPPTLSVVVVSFIRLNDVSSVEIELPLINKVFPITTLLVEEPISVIATADAFVLNLKVSVTLRVSPPWISFVA